MSLSVLKEIQAWRLEARLEDTERYFYEVVEVEAVRSGRKSYVIGRKGTGKTAIGERFLAQNGNTDHHVTKLSFKNFPFNHLYKSKDIVYTRPNQFITVWKYIIYMSICKMMRDNLNINHDARSYLAKLIPPEDQTSISRLLPRWIGKHLKSRYLVQEQLWA